MPPRPEASLKRGSRGTRPHHARTGSTHRAKDQAMPGLQGTIPERVVRRARVPSLQVREDLAQRRRRHAAGPL